MGGPAGETNYGGQAAAFFAQTSPLATLRREGATPPPSPVHSYWQTTRPPPAHELGRCQSSPGSIGTDTSRVRRAIGYFDHSPMSSRGKAVHNKYKLLPDWAASPTPDNEGGIWGSFRGVPKQAPVVITTDDRHSYQWAAPKVAAKAKLTTKRLAQTLGGTPFSDDDNRGMILPHDFVRWEVFPAGMSTLKLDQKDVSQYLDYNRRFGMPRTWSLCQASTPWNQGFPRGAAASRTAMADDGMVLQQSFGNMQYRHLSADGGVKKRSFFMPGRQTNIPELRRIARHSTSLIQTERTYPPSSSDTSQ
eukprot:TRINITY_DN12773_c0_g1_i1.p1 TRINITY_DN12773_c0_g1~~TRINITY_DN12773_c0_g1_i1.p1  ORF type:complete len:331 (+),score=47.75 TRINITY_DN12773_c0_g1_i1:80-994(+)